MSSPRLQGVVSQVLLLPRTDAGVAGGLRVGVHAGGGAAGRVRRQQALGEAPLMMAVKTIQSISGPSLPPPFHVSYILIVSIHHRTFNAQAQV